MKRILFVIGTMGNGGAERVIAALSNSFVSKGIEVRIISIYGNRQDYELNSSIEVCSIFCKNKIRIFRPIERIKIIKKRINEFNPDCVISFLADVNIHTILAMIKSKIPLIVSERNDPEKDPTNGLIRKIRDKMYKYADAFVFQTPDALNYFEHLIPKNKKRIIIPNPLTPGLPFHNYISDNKRIITACRLNPQKNLKLMVDSINTLRKEGYNCELEIYGSGPLKEELESYIINQGIDNCVRLKGFSNNIHKEMQNSRMFVISSDYEGISNSMLEALAIGIPVVATDCPVGGARMFIINQINGLLTKVGDKKAFTEAIRFYLDNPEKAELIGKKATEIRNILDIDVISDSWLRYLQDIIK